MDGPGTPDHLEGQAEAETPRRPGRRPRTEAAAKAEGQPAMFGDQPDFTAEEIALMDEVFDRAAEGRRD